MSDVIVKPCRVRLQRTKGWRLAEATENPLGVVKVDRTTKWGNPFVVHRHTLRQCGAEPDLLDCPLHEDLTPVDTPDAAVLRLKHLLLYPLQNEPWYPPLDTIRHELAGWDLACWCGIGKPCHADLLLALANGWEVPA